MTPFPLASLPPEPAPDDLLEAFLAWVDEQGLALYPAQEEAILEVFTGRHVILETPTGSGKSLVALAAHVAALARGQRSVYTAPIKALVSEKFFDLCRVLGPEQVGMLTGDASVNPDAPVICCTAEVLASMALRTGAGTPVDQVCMDEFHYYADPQRGVAWQIPLLVLTGARFLLMSATLGDTRRFRDDLERRTGVTALLVSSATRPVPLHFEYRETLITETIQELLDLGRVPVYVVHFTQAAATERAQALTSLGILTRAERRAVGEAVGGFAFDSPFGKDLARFVRHGIGVHHAGLLPKYRLLVEKLAQQGLLRVICGTDTLGVGVNIPIRTVLFTQLCKYDGRDTRLLSGREFLQIAGRAGRRGFDTEGDVWAQAPEHVAENLAAEARAAGDPTRRRKLVRRKAPERGYKPWNRETFERLVAGRPEPLESSFTVGHGMVLELIDRPGDGCAALRRLLVDNHEPRARQRHHIRRAIHIYRALVAAGVVEVLGSPDEMGRRVRLDPELQSDFRLDQPLSPFILEALDHLDPHDPSYALDVVSVVESVLENPRPVLARQTALARDELMAALRAERVPYEQRMEELARVTHPKPLAGFLYEHFDRFRTRHPWVGSDNVSPKAVARDLFEQGLSFRDYIQHYGLKRSEGLVLRYLTEAYKALEQSVPEEAKTPEVRDFADWLGAVVRQVDASLLAEWERLRTGEPMILTAETPADEVPDITTNRRAFRVMVANEVFRWVRHLARHDEVHLAEVLDDASADGRSGGWTPTSLAEAMAPYWSEHDSLGTGPDARAGRHLQIDDTGPAPGWVVRQALADPEEWYEWGLHATVDPDASGRAGRVVARLDRISRL